MGDAFEEVAERNKTDFNKISDRTYEESFEIEIANHKDGQVTVTVTEHIYGDWKIRKSSHPYTKVKAYTAEFAVPVEPDSTSVLTYTVRRRS